MQKSKNFELFAHMHLLLLCSGGEEKVSYRGCFSIRIVTWKSPAFNI